MKTSSSVIVIVVLIIVVTATFFLFNNYRNTTTPDIEKFFRSINMSISGTALLNQPVELTVIAKVPSLAYITNNGTVQRDISNAKLEILLLDGIELVSGNPKWEGNLQGNETIVLKPTIKAIKTGNYAIQFLATANQPTGFIALETKFLYISVSESGAVVSDTPSSGINYNNAGYDGNLKGVTEEIK